MAGASQLVVIRILKREPDLDRLLARGGSGRGFDGHGHVVRVTGPVIEADGPSVPIGEVCRIGEEPGMLAEVVGFRDEHLLLIPLGAMDPLRPGCEVVSTGGGWPLPIGDALRGRTIDGLGNPLDGLGPLHGDYRIGRELSAPDPMRRPAIRQPFQTGIKSIDTLIPIGAGQRVGIFGGGGVGKSTLLGMIARQSQADVNVIALIGVRPGEVNHFLQRNLAPEIRKKSVVIVATADAAPLQRVKAGFLAMTIAEQFRDDGEHVLLVVDSLTGFAVAQREIGTAIGESVAAAPSMVTRLAELLGRAGSTEGGIVTGIFSVLADAGNHDNSVADAVRSIVDGEVALSRELALQNHFPAVDVFNSISRFSRELLDARQLALVAEAREALALYRAHEKSILTGDCPVEVHPALKRAIRQHIGLQGFLRQNLEYGFPLKDSWNLLAEALALA